MGKRGMLIALSAAWLAIAAAGCGKTAGTPQEEVKAASGYNNEPVKLTIYDYQAGINDRELQTHIVKPIQAKYPNITFELLNAKSPEDLAASGIVPDLVTTSNVYVKYLLDLGFGEDLQSRVKTSGLNLGKLEPEVWNELKKFGPKGELYGLPLSMNYGVMLYNKEIFDKLGVAYPKDGMTWTQTLELAKKVTRTEGGVRYIGVSMGAPQGLLRQYSLPVVDEKQEKSIIAQTEGYKTIFSLLRQLYDMNGYLGPNKEFGYGFNEFIKDQTLAMNPNWIAAVTDSLAQLEKDGKTFKWDMVSYPAFDDKPKLGRQVDFHLFMIPPASKNKNAAFEAVRTLLTDEAQTAMNKAGRMTVLKEPELKKNYAADLKIYANKNLEGIFKATPAPAPTSTNYDTKIYSFLQESNKEMAQNGMDLNTALRVADEKANKYIQEMKQQGK
ncbi:ABC transporter substrate-binding protein [Paenibacillus ginsengarvi]|uniref:Extracellular solute-binding protein n=1 Tax=Paenibacillus ginsengarvi TaxID=400777 RepID=A0A3B0AQL3_9BACL|nr:extracellular solute-binding protein [Paenibacillus ginsengarvi]RKN62899.1 extracellular solute-binding protein [Paenibacillus ginsengarvi]